MTNWRKAFETDLIFNLILRKTIDEFPGEDIEVELEINTVLKDGNIVLKPGHEWYFTYKQFWRYSPRILWKYRLKSNSLTELIGGIQQQWTIKASVLNKVHINEMGDRWGQTITEVWGKKNGS